jgi:hypothetical protein
MGGKQEYACTRCQPSCQGKRLFHNDGRLGDGNISLIRLTTGTALCLPFLDMNRYYSRESSRTRARKRLERIIRTTFYLLPIVPLATLGWFLWKRDAQPRMSSVPESPASQSELAAKVASSGSPSAADFKARTTASAVMFLDRQVIQVNARGEFVPDSEAVFAPSPSSSAKARTTKGSRGRVETMRLDPVPNLSASNLSTLLGGSAGSGVRPPK